MLSKAALLLLALCLAVTGVTVAEERGWDVGDVEGLSFCLPITVLVAPTEANTTSIAIDAEPDVAQAFVATVVNGTMGLGLDKGFKTEKAVRVTVSTPAKGLKLIRNVGVGDVLLGKGFELEELRIVNTGTGRIVARDVGAEKLVVEHSGAGELPIFLDGRIGAVEVTVNGVGDLYVLGVETSAAVTILGVSRVHVSGGPALRVTGTINGVTDGVSTNGSCELTSNFPIGKGPSCDELDVNNIPDPVLEWQCGVEVEGEIDCLKAAGSGASASASTSGNAMATATATGDGTQAQAESSPSGVGASGPAVASSDVKCSAAEDLEIEF